ncbi:hypothetical protein [Kitasatospora sp. NPDC085464]|uniref:hypothetical protein n=1 Tax=Kitasatospora sp. NPDC085464 TaxID=3364063 RepID=UPI0037CCA16E
MTGSPRARPLHDMGGATGPADTAGPRSGRERSDGPERRPAPIGKGGTPNVSGSDEQQPELAEGAVPGVAPGEEYAGPPHREPSAVDPPPRPGRGGRAAPAEPIEALPEPGLGHHDPAAEPEDEGIPDLQDGSPGAAVVAGPPGPGRARRHARGRRVLRHHRGPSRPRASR